MRTFAQKDFAIFKHQSCGCRIQSVYQHLDVNLCNLRQDFALPIRRSLKEEHVDLHSYFAERTI